MNAPPDDDAKRGATDAPGEPQPKDTEVESARLLANDAAPLLEADGLDRDEVRRLADAYIAAGNEGDTERFVRWVRSPEGTPPP
jgi:hypothetical protein